MSTKSIEQLINIEAQKIAKELTVEVLEGESLYQLGAKVFIRTVTYHYTGQISFISDKEIVLSEAAWIADSGRFANALKTGILDEVEPYPNLCGINRDAIIDASPWNHKLPRETK